MAVYVPIPSADDTLTGIYGAGGSQTDSTITLDATRLGLIVDGTGINTVPLTIKNGKSQSGVLVQATGTAPSGYLLNNAAGVRKGALGIVAATNDWFTGSAVDDVVMSLAGGLKWGLDAGAAATLTLSANHAKLWFGDNTIDPGLDRQIVVARASGLVGFSASSGSVAFNAYSDATNVLFTSTGGGALQLRGSTAYIALYDNDATIAGPVLVGTTTTNNAKFLINFTSTSTSNRADVFRTDFTFSPTSGTAPAAVGNWNYTINQTGGANGTISGLLVAATETAVVGTHNLFNFTIGGTSNLRLDNSGGLTMKAAALATSATVGHLSIRTCAGTPTGAVADGALVLDTTAGKLWARTGGAWKGIALA